MQPSASPPKDQFIVSHCFDKSAQLCLVRETLSCQPKLLLWNGSTASVGPTFELEGRLYKPLSIAAPVLNHLRLPLPPLPYHSIKKLVDGIATAFVQRGYLEESQARLLTYCCLASWFGHWHPASRSRVRSIPIASSSSS